MHGEYQRRLRFLEHFIFQHMACVWNRMSCYGEQKKLYKLYYISRVNGLVPCKYYYYSWSHRCRTSPVNTSGHVWPKVLIIILIQSVGRTIAAVSSAFFFTSYHRRVHINILLLYTTEWNRWCNTRLAR